MTTTSKSGIMLKKTSAEIAKFKAINGPGVYELYAGNNNWIEQEGLKEGKYIVNLKAIAKHNIDKFLALFTDSDEIAIEDLSGLTMTANIIVNNGKANIPMKNQLVKVMVDYVDGRNGKVLVVTSIEVPKAMKGSSLFSDESVEEDNTRIAAVREEDLKAFEANKDSKKVTA